MSGETREAKIDWSLYPGVWGFMEGDVFVALPKHPMIEAGLTQPPFDVTMSNGSVRHVIVRFDL